MRARRRLTVACLLVGFLLVPREGAAFWNWIHEMSGPGPFTTHTPVVYWRLPLPLDMDCLGLPFRFPSRKCDGKDAKERDTWMKVAYMYDVTGDRERGTADPSQVSWSAVEIDFETSRIWDEVFRIEEDWLVPYSSIGGAVNWFRSDQRNLFPNFAEPGLHSTLIGVAGMSLSLLISARADGSFGQSYQATCLPSFVSLVSMR